MGEGINWIDDPFMAWCMRTPILPQTFRRCGKTRYTMMLLMNIIDRLTATQLEMSPFDNDAAGWAGGFVL